MRTLELYNGNCLTELQKIADNTIDSVVTDPPYELGFMGKSWDASGIAFNVEVWRECLRVLKPGGHILAFGGTRTYHRMTVAIEDAGFEIRDCIAWMYGSGFPKSHNIALAIDKAEGATGHRGKAINIKGAGDRKDIQGIEKQAQNSEFYHKPYNEPISDNAKDWNGWGTALKPAFEPIVMGRKPFKGTVKDNVLEWGVGGLNIDESRIGESGARNNGNKNGTKGSNSIGYYKPTEKVDYGIGRWPANVMLDEEAGKILDEQSGKLNKQAKCKTDNKSGWQNEYVGGNGVNAVERKLYLDEGGASRFFYCPKASKKDRGDNTHPTVKPTTLMEYLIKLVTPKGGKVLDPFMGSGSTGKGAVLNDYSFVGIELSPEYFAIAESRINAVKDKTKFWC